MRILVSFLLFLTGLVISLGQEISGIGVALSKSGADFVVQDILPDSPAALSKAVHRADRIIAIAQGDDPPVPMTGLGIADAVRLIRGPKGTVVRLTLVASDEDDSKAHVIRLVRGQLRIMEDHGNVEAALLQLPVWFLGLGAALAPF